MLQPGKGPAPAGVAHQPQAGAQGGDVTGGRARPDPLAVAHQVRQPRGGQLGGVQLPCQQHVAGLYVAVHHLSCKAFEDVKQTAGRRSLRALMLLCTTCRVVHGIQRRQTGSRLRQMLSGAETCRVQAWSAACIGRVKLQLALMSGTLSM